MGAFYYPIHQKLTYTLVHCEIDGAKGREMLKVRGRVAVNMLKYTRSKGAYRT